MPLLLTMAPVLASAACQAHQVSSGGSAGTTPEVAAIDGQLFGFLLGTEHMYSLAKAHNVHCWLQWAQDGLDAGHAGQQQAVPCAGPCTHDRTLESSPTAAGQGEGGCREERGGG